MGSVISNRDLKNLASTNKLIVLSNKIQDENSKSINKQLAEKIIEIKPIRRSARIEECFKEVVGGFSDNVVLKDIDVLFNPNYKIDVLKVLISVCKYKPIRVIWPGTYKDGKLIYSEESLSDYKTFEITNYDIYYVD